MPLNRTEVIYFKVLVQMVFEFINEAHIVICHKYIIYIDYKNLFVIIDVNKIEIGVKMGIGMSPTL